MDYGLVWTAPAGDDLEAIIRYIAQDNPSAAARIRVEFLETGDQLGQMPLMGSVYKRDPSGRTREVLCRHYRIFYRVDETAKRVEILTIWYGARREPKLKN